MSSCSAENVGPVVTPHGTSAEHAHARSARLQRLEGHRGLRGERSGVVGTCIHAGGEGAQRDAAGMHAATASCPTVCGARAATPGHQSQPAAVWIRRTCVRSGVVRLHKQRCSIGLHKQRCSIRPSGGGAPLACGTRRGSSGTGRGGGARAAPSRRRRRCRTATRRPAPAPAAAWQAARRRPLPLRALEPVPGRTRAAEAHRRMRRPCV